MIIRLLKLGLLVAVIAVLFGLVGIACGGGNGSGQVEIPVRIERGKLIPGILDVKTNDKVILKIQSDEAGEVSVQAYNVAREVKPGEIADLYFVAFHKTGGYGGTFAIMFRRPGQELKQSIGTLRVKAP